MPLFAPGKHVVGPVTPAGAETGNAGSTLPGIGGGRLQAGTHTLAAQRPGELRKRGLADTSYVNCFAARTAGHVPFPPWLRKRRL